MYINKYGFYKIRHHSLLLKKLYYDLTLNFFIFFQSYLSHRIFQVECNGCKSIKVHATSGVSQSSVFGPFFFNIFINDVTLDIFSDALVYIDDLKLFICVNNIEDCLELQSNIATINQWCKLVFLILIMI